MPSIQLYTHVSGLHIWGVAVDQERLPRPECKQNLVKSRGEAGRAHVLLGCGGGERF